MEKPLGTIQVDVDSISHLLRFYGFDPPGNKVDDPIYEKGLYRFRMLSRKMKVKMTFMVVGEDLLNEKNLEIVAGLHREGHEIANHSMDHCYGFSNLSAAEKERQICEADRLITKATGEKPEGFKAPGWDIDGETLDILERLNYIYDSSVFPSPWSLLMKLTHSVLKNSPVGVDSGLGKLRYCMAPIYPYLPHRRFPWRRAPKRSIVEIPTTVTPIARIPFYSTLMLNGPMLFDSCLKLMRGRPCNFVFHAVDLMKPDELDPRVLRHPGTSLALGRKWRLCVLFIERLKAKYRLVTSTDMAKGMLKSYQ